MARLDQSTRREGKADPDADPDAAADGENQEQLNVKLIQLLSSQHRFLLGSLPDWCNTPLNAAVKQRNEEAVLALLDAGADINAIDGVATVVGFALHQWGSRAAIDIY